MNSTDIIEVNQSNYYAIIPANVRYSKDICMGAKLLYGEITALTNEKGFCWATNEYFQNLYNVEKNTIIRWINQLIKNNFIYRSIVNNQRHLSIVGGNKNNTPSIKKVTPTVSKKLPINNKKNNTSDKLMNDKKINDKLTNYLINQSYIDFYEPCIEKYNELFKKHRNMIGEENLNTCISYIISKIKDKEISNKYKYLENSIKKYENDLNFNYI